MFRFSGDIDGLLSASGADALTTKRVSLVQSTDFMPRSRGMGENRGEDTSWKHSDSPYSADRRPYIGPADDGQPDGNRARRAGVRTRPARWRPGHGETAAAGSLRGAEEDDLFGLDLAVVVEQVQAGRGEDHLLAAEIRLHRQHEQRVAVV